MGKKTKDNKKKGKGAEKTALKTDKKLSNKQKKELEALGEDNIESILEEIEKEEKKRLQVQEHIVEQPSRRLNFSFVPHPDKDELIMYGGEYFNGQKTFVYNDLYFYNIPNNTWTHVKAPAGPPPRCGHQMVATATNKGQLWVFGGEYASPTQSQFYHYRDLWLYQMAEKRWEKVTTPNGPSARSGHRMVYNKKQLFVFGGFHDNLRDYKYFNDIYCFNTESYKWIKIEATGTPPAPRSACCMVPLNDGKILIYGGYSKEKLKKDVDKGHVFTDSFLLTPEKNDTTGTKYKWVNTKLGGISFSPRCSMPITAAPNNTAYCFGGVFDDEEDEENISGTFFDDLLSLDLEKLIWRNVNLSGKKDKDTKRRRNKDADGDNKDEAMDEDAVIEETEEMKEPEIKTIADDGIFKVTLGPAPVQTTACSSSVSASNSTKLFHPHPRMNCGMAIKHGVLYLYGGMVEEGEKELTLCDFHALDLKKLEEWKTIVHEDIKTTEWLGSDDSGSDDEDGDDEETSDDSNESDDKVEANMETN